MIRGHLTSTIFFSFPLSLSLCLSLSLFIIHAQPNTDHHSGHLHHLHALTKKRRGGHEALELQPSAAQTTLSWSCKAHEGDGAMGFYTCSRGISPPPSAFMAQWGSLGPGQADLPLGCQWVFGKVARDGHLINRGFKRPFITPRSSPRLEIGKY